MAKQQITYASEYKGHKIQANKARNQGCIANIVEGYHNRVEYMVNKHRQVSVMLLVVTPPRSIPLEQTNKAICSSLNALKKTLANNGIEIHAGWVREIALQTMRPHYHIGVIINGSKCQNAVGVAAKLAKLLQKRSSDPVFDPGNVHYCTFNHACYNRQEPSHSTVIKIRRDLPNVNEQIGNVLHRLSYDAKTGIQKALNLPGRDFGFTLLPQ